MLSIFVWLKPGRSTPGRAGVRLHRGTARFHTRIGTFKVDLQPSRSKQAANPTELHKAEVLAVHTLLGEGCAFFFFFFEGCRFLQMQPTLTDHQSGAVTQPPPVQGWPF